MPAFEQSPEPDLSKLAIYDRSITYEAIAPTLGDHFLDWLVMQEGADDEVNAGDWALAANLTQAFTHAAEQQLDVLERASNPKAIEDSRVRAVGVLSLSFACKRIIEAADLVFGDAAAEEAPPTLLIDAQDTPQGEPLDPRLHIAAEGIDPIITPTAAEAQWYRHNNLYLLRTAADPTTVYQRKLVAAGHIIDFSPLVTLRPYLAVPGYAGPPTP